MTPSRRKGVLHVHSQDWKRGVCGGGIARPWSRLESGHVLNTPFFFQASRDLSFSDLSERDKDELTDLVNAVFLKHQKGYEPRKRADFETEFYQRPVFTLKLVNKIVSVSTIRLFDEAPSLGLLEFTCTGEEYRREGYASRVMDKMFEYASNKSIDLYSIVEWDNVERQQMLSKNKFYVGEEVPLIFYKEDLIDQSDSCFKWTHTVSRLLGILELKLQFLTLSLSKSI